MTMTEIPALVCRPQPYEDESLQSYLIRVQMSNGYKHLNWLTGWLRGMTGIPVPNRLNSSRSISYLEGLAQATRLPVLDVYGMTLNRYIMVLALPETPLMFETTASGDCLPVFARSRLTGRWLRSDRSTAFCPACLREDCYHRLTWLLGSVFACTRHAVYLRDTCANCEAKVSVTDVVHGLCSHCGTSLTEMPALSVDVQSASVQTELLHCLQASYVLADGYVPLSAPFIFRFLDGICAAIRGVGWDWMGCYHPTGVEPQTFPMTTNTTLTTIQQGTLYVSAWRVLCDWPTNFYLFLDQYRQRPGAGRSSMRQFLGYFYDLWLERFWRHPEMEVVQAAFNAYFVENFPATREIRSLKRLERYPELEQQLQFIDVRNAARSLGVSPPKIERLVRDGYVRMYPEHDPARPGYFVYRSDLEHALQREPEKAHIRDVAREFSVGMSVISDWIRAGLIQPSAERQLHGVAQPVLTQQDVDVFHRRLAQHIQLKRERPVDVVCLRDACIRNGKVGMNSAQLLQRVLDGKICAYHTDPDLQPFDALWFDPHDVTALTEQVKVENNWIGFLEVWRLLDVSRDVVHLWIERKVLVPVATFARAIYFDRDAVLHFHSRLIRSNELATWFETSRSAISQWVRAGHLPVLSGMEKGQGKNYIFDRDVMTEWHTLYVTSGELRRVLGSEHYLTFLKCVRHGDYAVSTNGTLRFFQRCDLEHFQLSLVQQL